MRPLTVTAAAVALAAGAALTSLSACSSISSSTPPSSTASGSTASSAGSASTTSCTNAGIQDQLYQKGTLTVATDKPAYTPWFTNNQPSNGQGYESAVAYAVGAQLGFSRSQVNWAYEPFDSSYAPGPKKFDFDINEISYTPQRATAVTFSVSYYNDREALIALKSSPIATKHTPAELKTYTYGDQIGTTSLTYINNEIQPTTTPKVYDTLNDVVSALQDKQIAAFVTDTPTAQYMASAQIPHSVLIGQFPSNDEYYGLLFAKGNPLVTCVNKALATLTANGTLNQLQQKYLQIYTTVPTIEP
jgi:polar amino acid transport system substrate-binding protein